MASPCHFFHEGLQTYILLHGDDFFIVGRREGRKHALNLLRSAYELRKNVTLGPESSQSRTASFFFWQNTDIATMENRVRARPAACVPRLEGLGIDRCYGCSDSWTDDVSGPRASQISELRRTAKWHDPLEEVREEDDLLTEQELKLFQCVPARLNFLAMDRPDLLY